MSRYDALAWVLVIALAIVLFFGTRADWFAGWSSRREYNLIRGGLLSIPLVIKGVHSVWSWLSARQRG
jgi:hypothetical protein